MSGTKMITCNVCGYQFWPTVERHYLTRDNGTVGIASAFKGIDECNIYDTFDSPKCGCQSVVQKRKRTLVNPLCDRKGDDEK